MPCCSLSRFGSPWGGGYGADSPRHPLVELLGPPGAPAIGGAAAGHRRARATQGTPTSGAAHGGFREGGEIEQGRRRVVGAVVDHETGEIMRADETLELTALSDCYISRVGLTIREGLEFEQWEAIGSQLTMIEGSVLWWIGDWLN